MTPEQRFNRWLIDNVFVGMHYQRIESTTGSGIPDFNVCWQGIEFWVESKVNRPLLRPFQWSWIHRRSVAGGRVFVLCEQPASIHLRWGPFNAEPCGKYMLLGGQLQNPPKSGILIRRLLAEHLGIR